VLANISQKDYRELRRLIFDATFESFQDLHQPEPRLVANLVWHLPRRLNGLSLSSGARIACSGVFVHAQPFVRSADFPQRTPASVELGDLLLLSTQVVAGEVVDRRAMLLQAKKAKHIPTMPDNPNQLYLYNYWPAFEYIRSTPALNGKKRFLWEWGMYNGAKYLLINNGRHSYPCLGWDWSPFECPGLAMTAQPGDPELSHYRCFCAELVNMILGNAGKPYTSPPPKWNRHWDRVIEDLTTVTAKRTSEYIKRASRGVSGDRGQMMMLCFGSGLIHEDSTLHAAGFPEDLIRKGDNLRPEIAMKEDDRLSGAISIIEFVVESETRESEYQRGEDFS